MLSLPAVSERVRGAVLALVAGLALAASVPPWGWWPLAFVGVALWDRALAGRPARSRAARSFLLGVTWLAPALLWMWDLTAPGYVIAVVWFAAYVAVAGLSVPGSAADPRARWLALPGALVLCEAARWSFPFEGVPLATTAMSQADAPLAQVARIGSAIGVVLVVGIGGVALSAASSRRWWVAGGALAVVLVLWGSSLVAPRGADVADLDVAVVQGGGPQGTRASDTDADEVFDRHMAASQTIDGPVDLVLWPENVVTLDQPLATTREHRELAALARRLDTTIVVGVTEDLDDERFTNYAVVYGPDGEVGDRYDKVLRVPFGEYVPFRGLVEPFAGSSGLSARDAVVGTTPAVLRTDVGSFGVAISWEVFFTGRVREGVREGGEAVLNPTNGSSYWLTQVQTQQVASSRLRAIETGRWVLQAAPTGFSAVVEPDGGLVARTGVSEPAVLREVITRRDGLTIATRIGPWPIVALAALMVAGGWILAWRLGPGSPDVSRRRGR
ncbi:MAG: apolipoprotein N-acyltransferase [Acidimicrobiales bacterium]|nr:apolipoprotein N-acyltransferase [Acidimicrobiales bacterium]